MDDIKNIPNFGFTFDLGLPKTGFNYSNVMRNKRFAQMGFCPPKAVATGTSVAAFIFNNGVILGSDKRSNVGRAIVSEECTKLHYIAENIYCGVAGVAADAARIVTYAASNMELQRLDGDHQVPVIAAVTDIKRALYERQGVLATALVVAGVDHMGSHVYAIYPHGSTDRVPFASTGSGFLPALSVFDSIWRSDLDEQEAMRVMQEAVSASIKTDLCTGANLDMCVIRFDGTVSLFRNISPLNIEMGENIITYNFKKGHVGVLRSHFEFMQERNFHANRS